MRVRLKGNPTKALNCLRRFEREMLAGTELVSGLEPVHSRIKDNVIVELKISSTRNPAATKAGDGKLTGEIIKNIDSKVFRQGADIVGGVGDTNLLDANDPLLSRRDGEYKLWRILESGAAPHVIAAKDPLTKPLHFWWKRRGMWYKAVSVMHPGQEGRRYFETIRDYETKGTYYRAATNLIRKVVKKYSVR